MVVRTTAAWAATMGAGPMRARGGAAVPSLRGQLRAGERVSFVRSCDHRDECADGQEGRHRQRRSPGRTAVADEERCACERRQDEAERKRAKRIAVEAEHEQECDLDVAHSERGGPAQADDQQEQDGGDAGEERERCAGREDDPVRDPPLREVEERGRNQRGAEHGDASECERSSMGENADARERRAAGSRSNKRARGHGARGAASACAETVRFESPTSCRRMVGKRRLTCTCTSAVVASACAWMPGSPLSADRAAACACCGSSASWPWWIACWSSCWAPARAALSASEVRSRRTMKAWPMSTAAPSTISSASVSRRPVISTDPSSLRKRTWTERFMVSCLR